MIRKHYYHFGYQANMLNRMSREFDRAQYDIWWNIVIKLSKQIGNSLAKMINTKVNSKPC